MIINSITTAGVAASVWANAARTLTADPATDAGAATLVWTHAARSITVDPATDAGAATLVWARATRTLTSLGAGTQTLVTSIHQSLAAGATADLRPAANKFRDIALILESVASASLTNGLYDGTTFRAGTNSGLGVGILTIVKGSSTFGPAVTNPSGNSSFYDFSGVDWNQ